MRVTASMVRKIAGQIADIAMALDELIDAKNEVLQNAESVEYPNAARIKKLEAQIDTLQTAKDDLELTSGNLDEYDNI